MICVKKIFFVILFAVYTLNVFPQANDTKMNYYYLFGEKVFWQVDSTSIVIIPFNSNVGDIQNSLNNFYNSSN